MIGDAAEAWLRRWAWALAAAVTALLLAEVLHWRPGFATGDESLQMRLLLQGREDGPLAIALFQGSWQRLSLQAWLALVPFKLSLLHLPGLLAFALELLLLWRLVKRWEGGAAAWGALAFTLLSATVWLRARSLLSFHFAPLALLLVLHAGLRVQGRWQAWAWGLAASLLLLDYEATVLALPFAAWACAEKEAGFRRRAWHAAGAFVLGAALLLVWQWPVLHAYLQRRSTLSTGGAWGPLLTAWLGNVRGLFLGAEPLAYLGIGRWPALAPWAWLPLGAGLAWALRSRRWGLLAWAGAVIALTQFSLSPWGLSPHRLSAAWPALALIAGLGLRRLLEAGGAWPKALSVLFCLGLASEGLAFARHMQRSGAATYGRSARLEQAWREVAAAAQGEGAPVLSGLLELRYPELRWWRGPAPELPTKAKAAFVFLPPQDRVLALGLKAPLRVWQRAPQEEPVLVMRADGALAVRFLAVEQDLRPLLSEAPVAAGSVRDRAWLAAGRHDPWARDGVLERELGRLWLGGSLHEDLLKAYASQAEIQPGPPTLLAKFMLRSDPARAQALLDRALALDPDYSPALEVRALAWEALGDPARAQAARAEWRRRVDAGAWQVYD